MNMNTKEKTTASVQKADRGGDWKQFRRFFQRTKLSWRWIILALAITILYYAAVSFVPGNTAALYAGEFTAAAILGLVVNYLCTLVLSLMSSVSQLFAEGKSTRSIRNSVWKRMMGVRTDFYDRNDPGSLLSAVTSDAEATVSTLITVIVMIPSLCLYLFMCLIQLSAYSKKLLAVLFVLVPVYILYAILMGRWTYRTGRSIQMRIGGLTGFLSERIRSLSLIKSFATEKQEEEGGIEASARLYKANVQYQYINGIVGAYTFVTEAVGIVVAVIWGCFLLRQGEIDLEAWLAFYLFVPMINTVLRQLSLMWSYIKELQGRASRMSALMDAPQEDQRAQAAADLSAGDIRFNHVDFAYQAGKPILKQVDFLIPEGKTTAIVGPTGSGKTTVLKLLEQLYTPQSGQIQKGEQAIDEVNLYGWRDRISYVTQDAVLFGGTVRECLTYGLKDAVSEEALIRVTKLTGVYDYIMSQPGGFDAELAIWGTAMSGGQRQRLVIARELLRDADLILLDEPTSALDAGTASRISDMILEQFRGKTIVTVTHELNFIAGADQIIVLNDGTVAGCGTHESLMEECGIYRGLVQEQSWQEVFAS